MWTATVPFLLAMLEALIEHDVSSPFNGPLEAVYFGLYATGTPTPTKDTVMADIIEPLYTGYARQEVVWSPPIIDSAGPYILNGGSLFFSPTNTAVSSTITGLFIASAITAGTLLLAQPLPNPGRVLAGPTQALVVVPQFSLPFIQIYGGAQLVA